VEVVARTVVDVLAEVVAGDPLVERLFASVAQDAATSGVIRIARVLQ
jgi:hypothetical protein